VNEESAWFPDDSHSRRAVAEVARRLCADQAVVFAVVFGSRQSGETTAASDLDIAVQFDDDCSSHERFRRRCRLSGELQRGDLPFVDVSDLDTLPLEVAADAVGGQLLCGDRAAFASVRRTVATEYAQRREELQAHHRSVVDEIAERGLRG
jgi:predicted nucleotidyltransferase